MKKIIPISEPSINKNDIDNVLQVMKSGWVSSIGKYINMFEENFAKFVGTKYALTTSNGTTGLHLALVSYGLKSGDEIIVPDLTFVATANVVTYIGAKPIFVDIESDSLCIDPKAIEKAITPKTKAIIPVHLYGHPANMIEVNKIAKKYHLIVIEDAAEAHGAEVLGNKVGSLGNCGVFSFYGNKIITTGEGGMITTNNENFYLKAKRLRDHAMSKSKKYWHDEIGYNYRMTNIQAALGFSQLSRINLILRRKRKIFELYQQYLGQNKNLRLNYTASWAKNVYWMVCLEIEGFNENKRNKFMNQLKNKGIDSRPFFYPISDMPMYKKAKTPVAHQVYQKGINIPSFFNITDNEIKYISKHILKLL